MGQIIFGLSVCAWLALEAYAFFFLNRNVTKENKDKKTKFIILALILFGLFGSILFDSSVLESFQKPFTPVRYAGIALILTGIAIRFAAIAQLGKSFSVNVGVTQESKLKTDGLYGIVRHPAYLGEVLAFSGVAICFCHPLSSLFAFSFPTAAFLYRIRIEEKVLREYFKEEYEEYAKRTKRLIPFIY